MWGLECASVCRYRVPAFVTLFLCFDVDSCSVPKRVVVFGTNANLVMQNDLGLMLYVDQADSELYELRKRLAAQASSQHIPQFQVQIL